MVAGLAIAMSIVMACVGVWLVDALYDTRYALAGPIVVLISFASIPAYAVIGSQNVLLASGDSRRYFFLQSAMAIASLPLPTSASRVWGLLASCWHRLSPTC